MAAGVFLGCESHTARHLYFVLKLFFGTGQGVWTDFVVAAGFGCGFGAAGIISGVGFCRRCLPAVLSILKARG
jgi:hypothetical protein